MNNYQKTIPIITKHVAYYGKFLYPTGLWKVCTNSDGEDELYIEHRVDNDEIHYAPSMKHGEDDDLIWVHSDYIDFTYPRNEFIGGEVRNNGD
jgi:hypothetical protein